jgi:hypothetical protein
VLFPTAQKSAKRPNDRRQWSVAAALPAYGHVSCGRLHLLPPEFNNLRVAAVGTPAALLTARNAK